jgi:hypothetical protein
VKKPASLFGKKATRVSNNYATTSSSNSNFSTVIPVRIEKKQLNKMCVLWSRAFF